MYGKNSGCGGPGLDSRHGRSGLESGCGRSGLAVVCFLAGTFVKLMSVNIDQIGFPTRMPGHLLPYASTSQQTLTFTVGSTTEINISVYQPSTRYVCTRWAALTPPPSPYPLPLLPEPLCSWGQVFVCTHLGFCVLQR